MRVAFLVAELGRSGGMAVIGDHAGHLASDGAQCTLVVCAPDPGDLPEASAGVPVRRLAEVGHEPVDVAIATWWTTAESLWDLPARRRAVFLQSLEQRYYREPERADAQGAAAVLDLPVDWLVVSDHLRRLLADTRPEARSHLVAPGIDKAIFAPAPAERPAGPLRVLVEGQPTLWFKGVAESVAAVRRMSEPATVTVVAPDPDAAGTLGADRVTGGLAPLEMAALYAEHDVLLKLARFEGLGLGVLEAFHVGRPCVVTPYSGAEGIVEHGVNGLVVGFDDEPGVTAALDRLARDPGLRDRLAQGALATATRWPGREAGSVAFAAAVRQIAEAEPPDTETALRRMVHGRRRWIEVERGAQERERGEGRYWKAAWEDADRRIGEYDGWTRELQRRLEAMHRRPGFRIEERLRRLGRTVRPGG